MKKQSKCCGKCAAKDQVKKPAVKKNDAVGLGRTDQVKIRMTPKVKERTLKMLKGLETLKGNEMPLASAWEYIILPTIESMVNESLKTVKTSKKSK